jgi:tetratricopeptide (TPR) repeat protein
VDLERYVLDPVRLGWHRDDDVASTVIPQQYFDYLRGGPVEPLVAILRHNQMDLRGLAALFGKINALLAEESGTEETESLDLFGLSRFLQRRGDAQRAHSACAQAIALGLPFEFDRQARSALARLAKRQGNHQDAAALWHELAQDQENGAEACEQLAIYYERRRKDFGRALEFAQLALAKRRRKQSLASDLRGAQSISRQEHSLAARVARLKLRVARETPRVATLPLAAGEANAANGKLLGRPTLQKR